MLSRLTVGRVVLVHVIRVRVLAEHPTNSEKYMWRLWCKALGEKASPSTREADKVALIRTLILVAYMATNLFIVAGVIKHWNDDPVVYYQIELKP